MSCMIHASKGQPALRSSSTLRLLQSTVIPQGGAADRSFRLESHIALPPGWQRACEDAVRVTRQYLACLSDSLNRLHVYSEVPSFRGRSANVSLEGLQLQDLTRTESFQGRGKVESLNGVLALQNVCEKVQLCLHSTSSADRDRFANVMMPTATGVTILDHRHVARRDKQHDLSQGFTIGWQADQETRMLICRHEWPDKIGHRSKNRRRRKERINHLPASRCKNVRSQPCNM